MQETLETALGTVLRLPAVALTVAGRTDAGVHATGQVAHADLPREAWEREQPRLLRRLAGVLPADLRVRAIRPVAGTFDARFAALWRRYEYRISDADWGAEPLARATVLAYPRRLDVDAMARSASALAGLHDFAAFCRRREGATTVRRLDRLDIARRPDGEIAATVLADAFCHSMVRSLIGALLAVGEGRRPESWPASLLGRDRRADEVTVAPAHGLTLVEVGYPPDDELAARAAETRAVRMRPA